MDCISSQELFDKIEWQKLFGNANPVEIEIGTGSGAFILGEARKNNHINYLGIEYAPKYAQLTCDKATKRGLTNIRVIRGPAVDTIARLVSSESVQAYHVYFPDPWPKKKHRKHRIFQSEFLDVVSRTLVPNGLIKVATDFTEYFKEIIAVFDDHGQFELIEQQSYSEGQGETNYERKYLLQGRLIHRGIWQKL